MIKSRPHYGGDGSFTRRIMITSGGAGDTPQRMDAVNKQVEADKAEFIKNLPHKADGTLDADAIDKLARGEG